VHEMINFRVYVTAALIHMKENTFSPFALVQFVSLW